MIICSVGIAVAFLGTVLLYFAARHAGAPAARAEHRRAARARQQPGPRRHPAGRRTAAHRLRRQGRPGPVPHLAGRRAQPGSGTGVGADERRAALGRVLRAAARQTVVDLAIGTGFLRAGLLIVGLLTLLIAASLLIAHRDLKRMLAYSSMENMGLIAIAAAAGTTLAIAALLLHVLAHGIAKTVLFLAAGQLQAATTPPPSPTSPAWSAAPGCSAGPSPSA